MAKDDHPEESGDQEEQRSLGLHRRQQAMRGGEQSGTDHVRDRAEVTFVEFKEQSAIVQNCFTTESVSRGGAKWRFTTSDARIKLKALYPQSEILE
ncbi:MAG: hypothetical protein KDA85_00585 [Planctomycetaceae bacterium]|nr:hypothetical protein [Planctomycetaceae bacterium]